MRQRALPPAGAARRRAQHHREPENPRFAFQHPKGIFARTVVTPHSYNRPLMPLGLSLILCSRNDR